jgi:hypothetical protein
MPTITIDSTEVTLDASDVFLDSNVTSLDRYLTKITSKHRDKPKFMSTVQATVEAYIDAHALALGLWENFDLDTALGPQLDVVGEWVGLSRNVPVPLANIYFSFDTPGRGWNEGIWKGPYDREYGITRLDDETYRRLLRARIAANNWDGTTEGGEAAFNVYFNDPETHVFINDKATAVAKARTFAFDIPGRGWDQGFWHTKGRETADRDRVEMRMTVLVSGKIPSLIDLSILDKRLIPIKPQGVAVDTKVTSVDNTPLFGFNMTNENVAGWNQGSWGVAPSYLLNL